MKFLPDLPTHPQLLWPGMTGFMVGTPSRPDRSQILSEAEAALNAQEARRICRHCAAKALNRKLEHSTIFRRRASHVLRLQNLSDAACDRFWRRGLQERLRCLGGGHRRSSRSPGGPRAGGGSLEHFGILRSRVYRAHVRPLGKSRRLTRLRQPHPCGRASRRPWPRYLLGGDVGTKGTYMYMLSLGVLGRAVCAVTCSYWDSASREVMRWILLDSVARTCENDTSSRPRRPSPFAASRRRFQLPPWQQGSTTGHPREE